VCELLRGSV